MTYKELYESAINKLEKSEITLGEFEKMIEPLNAEVGCDSDTISRQAAIKSIESEQVIQFENKDPFDDGWNAGIEAGKEAVEQFPPAQPEQLSTNLAEVGTDCISRQAAIDLLKQMRKDGDMIPWEGKDVFARIRKLPSAQPERIIHCKDCEWWTKQECSPQGRCALSGMYPTGGWFCGNARRREVTA